MCCDYTYARAPLKGKICGCQGWSDCRGKVRCKKHRVAKTEGQTPDHIIKSLRKSCARLKERSNLPRRYLRDLLEVIREIADAAAPLSQ